MTAEHVTLGRVDVPTRPWLQLARPGHAETLRVWRNANASRFYDKTPITADRQKAWMEAYASRPEDYLFMVMECTAPVGCIGIRWRGDAWDLYNVMRGVVTPGSVGFMSEALAMVIGFAVHRREAAVRLEVLGDNPAIAWYGRNGFAAVRRDEGSVCMVYRGPIPPFVGTA